MEHLGYPLDDIIRRLDTARKNNGNEFSMPLREWSKERFSEVELFFKNAGIGQQLSSDLEVFIPVSDLQEAITGIRSKVLILLTDARQCINDQTSKRINK